MPAFLLGLIFLYFFFFRLHLAGISIFPGSGYVPLTEDPLRWAQHLVLPWLTIALVTAAVYSRLTRGSMLDVLGEDYIRTARAKGLGERRVVYRHGLRSAVTPVVTQFGIDLGTLLGGVIVVEIVFGLPGTRSTRSAVGDDAGPAGDHRHGRSGVGVHRRRQHPRRHLLRDSRPACAASLMAAKRIYRAAGLVLTEHEFTIPLEHDRPDGQQLTVFGREIGDSDDDDRPLLVYLQGGPGMEAARPTRRPLEPTWLERALRDYRVLMLDQRGTGRSTPVGALVGLPPAEQAAYLSHFRADSIVRDAEVIRQELGVEQWSVLGQSFGGFCVTAICRWPLKACGRHSSQADCLPSDSTRTRSTAAPTHGCSSGTAVTTIAIPTIGSVCARCIA